MKNLVGFAVALALASANASAMAQTPAEPEAVARYGDAAELMEALIKPGRCPKGHKESYMVPCAVVKYVATDDALDVVYRPIFRVVSTGGGKYGAWTISLGRGFRTEVRRLSIDEVHQDILTPGNDGDRARYMPVDVFGYRDNQAACNKDKFSKDCHSSPRLQTDPFERYRFELPTVEADKIWR